MSLVKISGKRRSRAKVCLRYISRWPYQFIVIMEQLAELHAKSNDLPYENLCKTSKNMDWLSKFRRKKNYRKTSYCIENYWTLKDKFSARLSKLHFNRTKKRFGWKEKRKETIYNFSAFKMKFFGMPVKTPFRECRKNFWEA